MLDKIVELGISKREAEELIKVSNDIDRDYKLLLEDYPIQYLIGYVNFYGYKIRVDKNVLIPRYETELLVEKTISKANTLFKDSIRIVDVGTGSGAIAIVLKKELKNCKVDAIDISSEALEVAKENAKNNNVFINFKKNDLLKNIQMKYDIIISNPPYISKNETIMDSVFKYEPHSSLFADKNGLYCYYEIIREAKKIVEDKHIISFEIGSTQGSDICTYAKTIFPRDKIYVDKDLSGKDRYVFIISE